MIPILVIAKMVNKTYYTTFSLTKQYQQLTIPSNI